MADFSRYTSSLHPNIRDVASAFLAEAYAAGLDPRVQEGYRSIDRQNQLYAQGRTAPGAIVTKARGGQSNHNYGVAFDVVPGALLGTKNWSPEDARWSQLGQLGAKHGLEWGGNWKFVDKPHFQMQGANWRKLQNDPAFAKYNPSGSAPTAPATPAGAPGGLADMMVAQQMPAASAVMPGGAAGSLTPGAPAADPSSMLLGDIASMFVQNQQQRQEQRKEEQAAEQIRRQALFGSIGSMFG
ncbi:D-alanyl-D-alanine carboxypeptidase family protein [Ochrobactrum quorumnocens]|uniref:D-alanyl-D-alanine carboxypeptidase family protein n=1 Tax=Ochrobactrum quorumnocens TaxID=271865 RepID=A0A248UD73_9HYPH|nr:M15 family metallopeptidase [[Ochrobactrum] quorumnocens]ASV84685.1 D-alanyl-D-alanine carboxypeptidase family protein [[Ochrobactrum] quorumnocens]